LVPPIPRFKLLPISEPSSSFGKSTTFTSTDPTSILSQQQQLTVNSAFGTASGTAVGRDKSAQQVGIGGTLWETLGGLWGASSTNNVVKST